MIDSITVQRFGYDPGPVVVYYRRPMKRWFKAVAIVRHGRYPCNVKKFMHEQVSR